MSTLELVRAAAMDADQVSREAAETRRRIEGEAAKRKKRDPKPPWAVLLIFLVVPVLFVVLYGWAVKNWKLVLVLLLVGTAALLVGGILGFLFGIPRAAAIRRSKELENGANGRPLIPEPSTSLEQVADWLTKILVGAGLVELSNIGGALDRFGKAVSPGTTDTSAAIVGEASAVLFAVLGFGASYLWTRTEYGGIQARADREVSNVFEQRLDDVEQALTDAASKLEEAAEVAEGARQNAEEGTRAASEAREAADEARTIARKNEKVLRGEVKQGLSKEAAAGVSSTGFTFTGFSPDVLDRIERFRTWRTNDWESDPNAELFEGVGTTSNGRQLSATIGEAYSNTLQIGLLVERTADGAPLNEPVVFLLHPSYADNRISVVSPVNDAATDEILSEGTFTVVAICDKGNTVLAFPLDKLPGAPEWFLDA